MAQIHLPNIIFTMMRPMKHMRPNEVVFRVPRHCNKIDIRNYLQSVYGANTLRVNTYIEHRRRLRHSRPEKYHKHPQAQPYVWQTMYKRAFVTLDEPFEFPAIPKQVQSFLDRKEKQRVMKEESNNRRSVLFTQNFDRVIASRYGDAKPLEDAVCAPLVESLKNLTLDAAAQVQGAAKNRLNPSRVKLTRRQMAQQRSQEIRERKKLERLAAEQALLDQQLALAPSMQPAAINSQ